ncbi:MAG: lysophospholipid acyltransferase family protein [Myxococcota bacterium]
MLQPTDHELSLLSPFERFAFKLADFYNRRLRWLARLSNRTFMLFVLAVTGGFRIRGYGVHNVDDIDGHDRVILVANHRSFFDYFVIMWVNFTNTRLSSRILFPVRSTFFYERPLGVLINLVFAGMAMFPPVMRDRRKRLFNQYSVRRALDELTVPGTLLGFHPEGTRNKTSDPYTLLPGKPGVGEIIIDSDEMVKVVPIFVVGMSNNLALETWRNWFNPSAHPIDVVYGAPIDFSDLRGQPSTRDLQLTAAGRCMDAITTLGEFQRDHCRLKFDVPPRLEEASGGAR